MKRNRVTHACGFVLTVIAFAIGSQWSRLDKNDGESRGSMELGTSLAEPKPSRGASSVGGSREPRSDAGPSGLRSEGDGEEARSTLFELTLRNGDRSVVRMSERELRTLVRNAVKGTTPLARRQAFDRMLELMRADGFDQEMALLMRREMAANGASREHWRLFDYAWGASDPEAALAHLEEVPERRRKDFIGGMLPGLASAQPETAIEFVSGMEDGLRRYMTGRLLEGLVDYDPNVATDYVYRLAEEGERNSRGYMRTVAREILGGGSLESGLDWADGLPEGPLQGAALVEIANEYANQDPIGASQWAEQYVTDPNASRIFGEVVREWGDWEAASDWVGSLHPGQAQWDGLSAVYGFRGATQPEVAVQEIIDMPPSPERNFAINGFISGLAHRDGATAVAWAAEITEPGLRQSALVRAGRHYYRQDQQAAAGWFTNSGLPEELWNRVTD